MSAESFYRHVMGEAGVDRARAERATTAVLHALRDRLTREEAEQAAAQLPRPLQALWHEGETPHRRPVKMHRRAFYDRVRAEAALASLAEARDVTHAVFGALKVQLSPGEAEDILTQLPGDLKEIWVAA